MTVNNSSIADSQPVDSDERLITDFSAAGINLGWFVLNDNVMGGRSDGEISRLPDALIFAGRTNTDGGGFSSIRTGELHLDLSQYEGIRVRVKGDGRRYTWRIATDARWRNRPVSYWANFETKPDQWITVDIPFADFVPRFRGKQLDGPELDARKIEGMGLMIYDEKDGPFKIQLDSVHAYTSPAAFSLEHYVAKKRLLVVSASSLDDPSLGAQLSAVAKSKAKFDERDMLLVVVVATGTGSRVNDRELTTNESTTVRLALNISPDAFALRLIGKDGSVKYSAAQPVAMSDLYALIDTMPMRRAEMIN